MQQRELVGEQSEHLGVRVGGLEQPRHRITRTSGGVERGRVIAHGAVGRHRVDAGHGEQVTATLVQDRPNVEERLQSRPKAAPGPASALGDGTQTSVPGGVQVQNAVRLAVANRTQHDRLRLQRAGHARPSPACRPGCRAGQPGRAILCEVMSNVILYTTEYCSRCTSAKALLARREIGYEEINLAKDPDGRAKLSELTGMVTFPQIVIDGKTLGGFDELLAADRAGRLRELIAA